MYYWLKNDIEDEGFYVISDDSDDVYIVGDGRPYKLKQTKHMLLNSNLIWKKSWLQKRVQNLRIFSFI
jgi:hypothetical protein